MADLSVFEFDSYKDFLRHRAGPKDKRSGVRMKMAEAMSCQSAYVSQVLYKDAHLSLEQAEKLSELFGLSGEEEHLLLLLVQLERAGTKSLTEYFRKQIEATKQKNIDLKEKLKAKAELREEQKRVYYSAWDYMAVHVATGIAQLQSTEALAQRFGLSRHRAREIVDALFEAGLLRRDGDRLQRLESDLYLHRDSPWIANHHANWRLKAVQSLQSEHRAQDLHYSGVVTLSEKDFEKVKAVFAEALKNAIGIVKESPEEIPAAIAFDVFRL